MADRESPLQSRQERSLTPGNEVQVASGPAVSAQWAQTSTRTARQMATIDAGNPARSSGC